MDEPEQPQEQSLPVAGEPEEWLPDRAVEALAMEREMNPSETMEQLARRLLRDSTGDAVMSILHLAKHGQTERIRFDASKYVIERVLGRLGDTYEGDQSPWEALFAEIEKQANAEPDKAPDYFRGA